MVRPAEHKDFYLSVLQKARAEHPHSVLASMLTVREAAREMGISEGCLRQRIRINQVPTYRFRGRVYLKRKEI